MKLDARILKDLTSNNKEKVYDSFKCVYNQYYKLVCFCISQYILVKEDVEELANDTFLSFFNHIEELDIHKNIKYYLLVIAKNKAINFVKRQTKYVDLNIDILENIPYEMEYESNDLINALKEVLSSEELKIMILHLLYGYSFKDIAQQKNLSINTVMSKYRRAINKANLKLKRKDYE